MPVVAVKTVAGWFLRHKGHQSCRELSSRSLVSRVCRVGRWGNMAFYRGCSVCAGHVTGQQLEYVPSGQLVMTFLLVLSGPLGLARKVPG